MISKKYFDVAANLCDKQFSGFYYKSQRHDPDHDVVIERARKVGVDKFLFASGHYEDVEESVGLCERFEGGFTTIGIHPCWASQIS